MENGIWKIAAVVGMLMFMVVPMVQAPAPTGSISGMKFNDTNGNGIKDIGEVGIAGWVINLTNVSSGAVITTKTDAAGNYIFSNLPDGTYIVGERIKPGYLQTKPAISFDGSATYLVTIAGGSNEIGKDFGNLKKGLILGGGYLNSGAEFIASGRYFGNNVKATGMVKYVDNVVDIESLSVNSSGIDGKMGVLTGNATVNSAGSYHYEVRMGKGWFNISVPDYPYFSNSTLKNGTITIADGGIVFTTSKSTG